MISDMLSIYWQDVSRVQTFKMSHALSIWTHKVQGKCKLVATGFCVFPASTALCQRAARCFYVNRSESWRRVWVGSGIEPWLWKNVLSFIARFWVVWLAFSLCSEAHGASVSVGAGCELCSLGAIYLLHIRAGLRCCSWCLGLCAVASYMG